ISWLLCSAAGRKKKLCSLSGPGEVECMLGSIWRSVKPCFKVLQSIIHDLNAIIFLPSGIIQCDIWRRSLDNFDLSLGLKINISNDLISQKGRSCKTQRGGNHENGCQRCRKSNRNCKGCDPK